MIEDALSQALFGNPENRRDGLLVRADGTAARPYRSINFIAHSLGGNVIAALIHEMKTRYGHERRARVGFVVTLGTPAFGSQIANVGKYVRWIMALPKDPLLESLQRDNTFLRMLQRWRLGEDEKAQRFGCRKVVLYAGVEGRGLSQLGGLVVVVPYASAVGTPQEKKALSDLQRILRVTLTFDALDHSTIAAPTSRQHSVYQWVDGIIEQEVKRLNSFRGERLCTDALFSDW